jgi:hypothetical protein
MTGRLTEVEKGVACQEKYRHHCGMRGEQTIMTSTRGGGRKTVNRSNRNEMGATPKGGLRSDARSRGKRSYPLVKRPPFL